MPAPKAKTRLLLLRHAEVEERYQCVFGGRLDMDLSPRGQEQARQLADYLRGTPVDALYVSPLRRARQTALPLTRQNGHQPIAAEGLREVDFGAWTGLTWDEVKERFGVSPYHWLRELHQGTIPGAEPATEFAARVGACLRDALAAQPGGTVAMLCHGGVVRMLLAILLDLPLPRMSAFEVDYASLTVVEQHRRGAEIQLLNFTPWRRSW
jgi:broad specificity phosphatase PhoE